MAEPPNGRWLASSETPFFGGEMRNDLIDSLKAPGYSEKRHCSILADTTLVPAAFDQTMMPPAGVQGDATRRVTGAPKFRKSLLASNGLGTI